MRKMIAAANTGMHEVLKRRRLARRVMTKRPTLTNTTRRRATVGTFARGLGFHTGSNRSRCWMNPVTVWYAGTIILGVTSHAGTTWNSHCENVASLIHFSDTSTRPSVEAAPHVRAL